jgi:hypothetical protein
MLDGRSNSNFHLVRLRNIDSAAQFSMFGDVEADVFVAGGEDMKDIYKKIDIGIWRLITLNSSLKFITFLSNTSYDELSGRPRAIPTCR